MDSGIQDTLTADARLIILRELAAQRDARLNEVALLRVLGMFGIARTRDWLRTQLRALADLEALRLTEVGSIWVATLRQGGRAHVDRRAVIEGVALPADED